jgi:hypothetical protein
MCDRDGVCGETTVSALEFLLRYILRNHFRFNVRIIKDAHECMCAHIFDQIHGFSRIVIVDIMLLETPSPAYLPRIIPARCSGDLRFKRYWRNFIQKPCVLYASVMSHELKCNVTYIY